MEQDDYSRRQAGYGAIRKDDQTPVTRVEVVEIVGVEINRMIADPKSPITVHFDSKIDKMMQSMRAITKDIVDGAVEASIRAHVEMAFPPGPIEKHKAHHQGLIDSAEQWKKIKHDILSWGAKGCIGFVVYVVGTALVEHLKREVTK